jgi:hypothetical protein
MEDFIFGIVMGLVTFGTTRVLLVAFQSLKFYNSIIRILVNIIYPLLIVKACFDEAYRVIGIGVLIGFFVSAIVYHKNKRHIGLKAEFSSQNVKNIQNLYKAEELQDQEKGSSHSDMQNTHLGNVSEKRKRKWDY